MIEHPVSAWDARLDDDVQRLLRRLTSAAARVHERTDDEAVHDLRVVGRRLDAALDVWRPLLRPRARRRAQRGLRGLRRRLGPVRDAEVEAATLREHVLGPPSGTRTAAALLLARLTRRVGRRRRLAAAWCAAERIARIRRWIERAFTRRRSAAVPDVAPAIRARIERLEGRARNATRALVETRDEPLHEARIATKRLRYALERCAAMGPLSGAAVDSGRIERLAAAQRALGRICDLAVLRERVARFSRLLAAVDLGAAAALEPVLALIVSEREVAIVSFRAGVAALDAVPAQWTSSGRAGERPDARADQG